MDRGADVTVRDTMLKSVLHAAVGDVKSMEALLQVKVAALLNAGFYSHFLSLVFGRFRFRLPCFYFLLLIIMVVEESF